MRVPRKLSSRAAIRHLVDGRRIIGRSEVIAFPDLKIKRIAAKIDTGAATAAIHCADISSFQRDGRTWVRFHVVLGAGKQRRLQKCTAPVCDVRKVKHSGGIPEQRYVIQTPVTLGGQTWTIELTLASRENLRFRVILGRQALREKRFLVHPGRRNVQGEPDG